MEGLADFLPLLFVLVYYLLAGRRKAAQRKAAAQRQEAPQRELVGDEAPAAATPFQSFLEQLEEAMAEANGEPPRQKPPPVVEPPPPAPTVVPEAPVVARPVPSLKPREFQPVGGSFDAPDAVDHEAHGFGRENPLSEQAFEDARAGAVRPASPRGTYGPHGLRRPPAGPTSAGWRQRLNDPEAARDAFVLQTIFGARGGRRRDPR